MSITNDGGMAFPIPGYINESGNEIGPEPGMTLRDYFASNALSEVYSSCRAEGVNVNRMEAAVEAYRRADAMLEARRSV